ncbi:RNA recognition domain-containing protein, partial [Colletotrichum orchidophilum]
NLHFPSERFTSLSPSLAQSHRVLLSDGTKSLTAKQVHHPVKMTDAARWKSTVFVGGLASIVTAANVHDAFIPFGEIADVSLPKNDKPNSTDPHRGFAYVEYEDTEDAKEAIDNMDQSEFFGRVIKVSAAKVPKSADEGLGSKKAVWEQEGWLAEHAVGEEDGLATDQGAAQVEMRGDDPMQGLEGLDVAGPRPE